MSKTIKVNNTTYHLSTNRIPRNLYSMCELDETVRGEFDYITKDDYPTARLFKYRGEWYDLGEFERAGHDMSAMGFDGIQTESYFSAVVVSYFESDGYELEDQIIVGYVHW